MGHTPDTREPQYHVKTRAPPTISLCHCPQNTTAGRVWLYTLLYGNSLYRLYATQGMIKQRKNGLLPVRPGRCRPVGSQAARWRAHPVPTDRCGARCSIEATQPQRGHAPPISHSPCTFLSLGCPHGQSGCNSLPFVPRGGAPGIILTGSRLLRTAPRAAQSPHKVPTLLSNSEVMSTEALGIIPNTPVHYRSERFEP